MQRSVPAIGLAAIGLALCTACLALASAGHAQPTFDAIGLGSASEVHPAAVSADGMVVVGEALFRDYEAFRWTAGGGLQRLGLLPPFGQTHAYDVSADGVVVVGEANDVTGDAGFRWTQAGGLVEIERGVVAVSADGTVVIGNAGSQGYRWTAGGVQNLGVLPGDNRSVAREVSGDGTVVVGTSSAASGNEAYRWTVAGGMQGLGFLAGDTDSGSFGLSADGAIVAGTSSSSTRREAFRWTAAVGMQGLGFLPGDGESDGGMVSADGSVVVGVSRSATGSRPFRWTEARGIHGLGDFPGGFSAPSGLSADGSVVVGSISVSGIPEAFVWDAQHGVRNLHELLSQAGVDVTGWRLEHVTALSADGRTLVGYGRAPNGRELGWVVVLPGSAAPECGDGLDNDGDGYTDVQDPGCPIPEATPENPVCDDGMDNDGDGHTDNADPQCVTAWLSWEEPCGLGAELAVVLPLVAWLRRRRRGSRR